MRIVRRNDLPQTLDIEYARELAQRRIAHASQQIELPERRPSHRKHARRRSRTNEISTIHLLICHRFIPSYIFNAPHHKPWCGLQVNLFSYADCI